MNSTRSPEKITLGCWPTPLQELHAIEKLLGTDLRLFMKRDDLAGPAFGGNKVRKLEYILADAMQRGCDCIVTGGGTRSNQTLAAAACAAQAGLGCYIVVPENTKPFVVELSKAAGAHVHFVPAGQSGKLQTEINKLVRTLKAEGHRPYGIALGAPGPLAILGYVDALQEIAGQLDFLGLRADHVFCAGGTGSTYEGLLLGTKLYSPGTRATVVSIGRRFRHASTMVKDIEEACQLASLRAKVSENDVSVYFSAGKGADFPTIKGQQAIKLLAEKEGIFLDPYFTGKAFAGLLELREQDYFKPGETIVFVHTGGAVSLV